MQKTVLNQKSQAQNIYKNPLETLRDLGTNTAQKTADIFGKIGGGMLDQFFGNYENENNEFDQELTKNTKKPEKRQNQIFNYNEYFETTLIKKQIKELTEQIKKEIESLKKAESSLLQDIKDIEKLTINDLPEKPGIYHIRFLEIVLNILQALRVKAGESKTWLQAMISRRKKRGSLFVAFTKKHGTQYSLSQELQNARSVQ